MTRRGPTIVQRVWDRRQRRWQHRIVRQVIRCRVTIKRKPTEAEALFVRA